jgi:hypothetical protein
MSNIPTPPVLILAGVLVCVAIGVEIARISLFNEGEFSPNKMKRVSPLSEKTTFKTLHTKFPKWNATQKAKHQAVHIPLLTHNIVENKHDGAVVITIFTDHASQSAREQEAYVKGLITGTNKYNIQINYKFMPKDKDITDGGLFEQIAYRNGIYNKYKILLNAETGNLTGDDFISILEKSGFPLMELRSAMRRDMGVMLKWLEADIKQAQYFEVNDVPVFFVNGHRLGTPDLPYHKINTFISRIVAGNEIWKATSEE